MKIRKMLRKTVFLVCFISAAVLLSAQDGQKDLHASLGQIPGYAETPDKGLYVDLFKVIDEIYTAGKIIIEIFPMPRSIDYAITGKSDFHAPILRNPSVDASLLPYRMVKEELGEVTLVIYSNADAPLTKEMIDKMLKEDKFLYSIECAGGMEALLPFPFSPTNNLENSLKKIESKRIDALVWAQEEVDLLLRNLKAKSIHREYYQNMDDVIITQKGARGAEIDNALSDILQKMKKTGRLQEMYSKIHVPFKDWQPADMGW